MNQNPLVSVIVPFYNSEKTIRRSLRCILGQTYENLEVIYVDDGSSDRGSEVCEKVAGADPRFKLIRKENGGVSQARNLGLDAATGEWVFFADADDWLVEDGIETLVREVVVHSVDFVITDFYRVAKGLVAHKHGPATGVFTMKQFLRFMGRRPADHYYSSLWNKLFKRSILEEKQLRFDTNISFGEDHVFILNYLRATETVSLVDRPLYYYIDTEGSLVHRGLNPFGVVKMKWKTYLPYLKLFNDVGLYRAPHDRPRIYKYIFMPCMDHFVDKGDAPFEPAKIFRGLESQKADDNDAA